MVATAKHHRQGQGPALAAQQADATHVKERRGGAVDGGAGAGNAGGPAASGLSEPMGGFIFVCNNDTMAEDLERQLFETSISGLVRASLRFRGLPQRYQDSVRAIQPGLPLFLYNYSTRCLHGVFEASSDGGLNIEPEAWENKDAKKNGRPVSRFPAQVRVRLREERPPLEEAKFRPILYHYDGPKFRLELTVPEAEELLELFGTRHTQKAEKSQDDLEGEWERVKVKSKGSGTRVHRPQPTKRSSSPNSSSGRRRVGLPMNGSSASSNASQSTSHYSSNGEFGRGREARADTAQRWRSDSDSWSGSSSAGLSTSSWASHDEERPKKGTKENGVTYGEANGVVRAGEYLDPHNATTVKSYEHSNGLCENGSERDSRADSDDLNTECNGTRSSLGGDSQIESQSPNRPGFTSYSAALKAGMAGGSTDVGSGGSVDSNGAVESGQTSGIRVASNVNVAVPSSANADFVGDGSKLGSGKHTEAVGSRRSSTYSEMSASGAQPVLGSHNGGDLVWQERKGSKSICWDGEAKKAESRPAWSDTKTSLAATMAVPEGGSRSSHSDSGSVGGRMKEGGHPSGKGPSGDGSANGRKSPTGSALAQEGERAGKGSSSSEGRAAAKDSADSTRASVESVVKKIPWQGNDAAVLRRSAEASSASNGATPTAVASSGQQTQTYLNVSTSTPESTIKTCLQAQEERQSTGQMGMVVGDVQQNGRQLEQRSDMASSASQTNGEEQGSSSTSSRPANDVRRGQQHNGPKERDEKVHFRRTRSPLPDQAPALVQQRQSGQNLMPGRISTPPLQSSHQQFHPDVVHHGIAYRTVPRGLREGDYGLQNGVVQGGWSGASSMPMIPQGYLFDANGMFTLPPQQSLVNAEQLHAEILEFAHTASPSAEARSCAEAAIDCVRDAVKKLWPSADVEVFGSYATGLCLSHSDVDVVVVDAPPPLETPETVGLTGTRLLAPSIRLLGSALRDYEWCKSIATIDSATMPVIKLHCRPSVLSLDPGAPVVKIDITIGGKKMGGEAVGGAAQNSEGVESSGQVNPNYEAASRFHNGAAAREYVIKRLHQQPALAPLVLLLKSYLQSKGLKDVYTGGLGSFSLTIMLVFYLERVPIAFGAPQEVRPQSFAPSNAPANSTLSADTTHSAAMPPGTDSLDSCEEESACSSTATVTVSVPNSASEGSLENGAATAGHASLPVDASKAGGCNQWTGGIVEQLMASMHSVASPNLGTLLIGFLHIFGWAIDFTQVRLVTKGNGGNGGLFYHDKTSGPVALTIDDPLRPGANIGAGSFNMHRVQGAMQEMFCILTRPPAVASPEIVGMGPDRRRALPLLDQLFTSGNSSLAPQ
ncbi:hypothetical protein M758_5G126500 [Ceratodon purpureus]|nr:hypothetical protein M758_5G126500 [Ceratodon purpureus]